MASLAQMLIVGLYILSLNWLLLLACIRIFSPHTATQRYHLTP